MRQMIHVIRQHPRFAGEIYHQYESCEIEPNVVEC
jgi:hypothetical protein